MAFRDAKVNISEELRVSFDGIPPNDLGAILAELYVRNTRDLDAHIRYSWPNPVKHGLVTHPTDREFSSIHCEIRMGRVEVEYVHGVGFDPTDLGHGFGEMVG